MQPDVQRDIYFDHAATTPVDSRVVEAMLLTLLSVLATRHHTCTPRASRPIRHWINHGQASPGLINAPAETIIFTSGATRGEQPRNTRLP